MRALIVSSCLFACAVTGMSCCMPAMESKPLEADAPHLEQRDGIKKLIVDGRPFICVAGELQNSTASDVETTKAILPQLAKAHLNTVLSVVSWDLVEPEEGKFDFSMVDYQIAAARENHLRLIVLWMGSWKNALSHYPPRWVKADQSRFPRVVNGSGNSLEILSTFSDANRDADAAAFAAVMRHIRNVDCTHRVIAVQVENEVGILGSTRDFCDAANKAFAGPVPAQLIDYLEANRANLRPELRKKWDAAGDKTSGTWEEVFGKNVPNPDAPVSNDRSRQPRAADFEMYDQTNEIFMAWNYAQYVGSVAAAGKSEYPIPMYLNTWIVQPSDHGPGDYPSGGGEPLVHDVWRAGAPAIDILAPDIYLPNYQEVLSTWARNGNPAWNPETAPNANNGWWAFTQANALCFSPFGIDRLNPDSAFARSYGLINSVSGAIAQAQGKPDAIKLITMQAGENPGKVEMGNYVFDFTPAAGQAGGTSGDGASAPPPTSDEAAEPGTRAPVGLSFLDAPFVLIINTGPDEYYFATNGNHPFVVSPKPPSNNIATAATIDRGFFQDGQWVLSRRYNGDDIMGRGYDLSDAAAKHQSGTQVPLGAVVRGSAPTSASSKPSAPVVLRVTFYQYH